MSTLDYATFYETHVRPRRDARRFAGRMVLVTFAVICPTLALVML
jgi:hypothetical protein